MIQITIFQDSEHKASGIELNGHAGYGEEGYDIVCAAVSALALNTVNSIEQFTDDVFTGEAAEDGGFLSIHLDGSISAGSRLLMDSLILGLTNIRDEYGAEYINIRFKEV